MIRSEDYLREFVQIIFAQKKVIILTTLIFTAAGLAIYQFAPRTFAADGTILVQGNRILADRATLENVQNRVQTISTAELNAENTMLTSKDVIESAIKSMAAKDVYFKDSDVEGENLKTNVAAVQSSFITQVEPNTSVIVAEYRDADPQRAVTILDHLFAEYVQFTHGIASISGAKGFFGDTADEFATELKQKEEELVDLAKKSQTADPVQEIESNLQIKRNLEQQLDMVRNDWIEKDLFVKHLREVLASPEVQFYSFIENESIRLLGEKVQTLVLERGQLLRIYSESSDKVQRVDEHIKTAYAALKAEVMDFTANQENQLNILRDQIESLEVRLEEINSRNLQLQETVIANQQVMREADLLKLSYDTFARRREEARVSGGENNPLVSVRVLTQPYTSGMPISPTFSVVYLGLAVGLIFGFALAFLREFFDHTFKKPEDVAKYTDLPTIMSIPNWEAK